MSDRISVPELAKSSHGRRTSRSASEKTTHHSRQNPNATGFGDHP